MAKKVSNNPIPNGHLDVGYTQEWSKDPQNDFPFSGKSVENFLKGELKEKIGYQAFSPLKDEDNYYHILGFANEECYNLWMTDSNAYAHLLLSDKRVPIKETSSASYVVNIYTSDNQDVIVSTTGRVVLNLRITSQVYSPIDQKTSDTGETVTLYVQRRTSNADAWQTIGTVKNYTTTPASHTSFPVGLDITDMLQDGVQQVRIRALGEETNTQSSNLLFNNITKTSVGLTFATPWWEAQSGGKLKLEYYIKGAVNKLLFVKIDGRTVINGQMVSGVWTESPMGITITDDAILTHGVHRIEAWMEIADDRSVKTDVVKSEVFYLVNTADPTPHMVIQEVVSTIKPYVDTTLFKYCVFSNVAEAVEVIVRVSSQDGGVNYLNQNLGHVAVGVEKTYANSIEIQSDETELTAHLYLLTKKGGDEVPLHTSTTLTIDNSDSFAPVKMESSGLIINPRLRSNEESNPLSIVNANGGAIIPGCQFEGFNLVNDLWQIDSAGNHSLKVPAGRKIRIPWDVFKQLRDTASTASLTFAIDCKISGLKDYAAENDPILSIGRRLTADNKILGFEMLPLRGYLLTQKKRTISVQDVQWKEDNRFHLTVNIINNVGNRGKNYVRIMLDSVINREFSYDNDVFNGSSEDDHYITIGNNSADIDIYSFYVYKQALSSHNVQQNFRAAIPTAVGKVEYRDKNDILGSSNTIDINKCQNRGYNTLRWIPDDMTKNLIPNYANKGNNVSKGTLEQMVYNANGAINHKYCRRITKLKQKGQGTSSITYWMWNISYSPTADSQVFILTSDGEWVLDESVTGKDCYFLFPNGLLSNEKDDIRGLKNVAKLNWASSMQSHKMGWCNLYTDLYWKTVGLSATNKLSDFSHTRKSVTQLPFFFFVESPDGCIFSNLMTFGPAKFDKLCFGTKAKSDHYKVGGKSTSWFTAIEGSANGRPLPERKVPWLTDEVFYYLNRSNDHDPANECLIYNGEPNLDVDKAVMNVFEKGTDNEYEIPKGFTPVDGEPNLWQETQDTTYSANDIYECKAGNTIKFFRRAYNFDYLHNDNLIAIDGTITKLRQMEGLGQLDIAKQYWVTQGGVNHAAYDLFRYDPITNKFVNAGAEHSLETEDGYAVLNLMEQCTPWFESYGISYNINNPASVNEAFIKARQKDYYYHSTTYYNEIDCDYDQAFRKFAALKDNWCKNTYEILEVDGLISMDSDDNDTSGDLDNVGTSKCPYYIEEHDRYTAEGNFDPQGTNTYWNSEDNVRYCLRERARGEEISAMLQSMLNAMGDIAGSVMDCMERYMFSTQRYFPATAYNEQSRLLYETAAVAMAEGTYTNAIDPLSQNLGNHLLSELEFWTKRIAYLASWCRSNEFANKAGNGTFSFRSGRSNAKYRFTIKSHQALYPAVMVDGTLYSITKHRMLPGETYQLDEVTVGTQDITCFLCGIDYLMSMGDLSGMPINSDKLNVVSKRLVEFIADGTDGQFAPKAITLSSPRLRKFEVLNVKSITGEIDLSKERLLETVDVRGTDASIVSFAESDSLYSVNLGSKITGIKILNAPALTTFTIQDASNVTDLHLGRMGNIGSYALCSNLYQLGAHKSLNNVHISGVNWDDAKANVIKMLAKVITSSVKGRINITDDVDFELKSLMLQSWGNIDSESNDTYVQYTKNSLTSIKVYGEGYITQTGSFQYNVKAFPANANQFESSTWSLSSNAQGYATISKSGLLRVLALPAPDSPMVSNNEKIVIKNTTMFLDGSTTEDSFEVGLFEHKAAVGDYVYADGSVSDVINYNKTVVGICYYINPDNPTQRLMIQPSDIGEKRWGLYKSTFNNITLADNPKYNPYYLYLGGNTTSQGAGFVTLTENILEYKRGDVIPYGLYNTLKIRRHCQTILADRNVQLDTVESYARDHNVDTRTALNACIEKAKVKLKEAGVSNYRYAEEYYYAATWWAFSYEPTQLKEGEVLAEKFKRGHWFLPGYGDWDSYLMPAFVAGKTPGAVGAIFAKAFAEDEFTWFTSTSYWTCSEESETRAWNAYLPYHSMNNMYSRYGKDMICNIRAVAAF